jgi:phospholipase C
MKVIQHIVFVIKENRSFDSYFGAFPGVDGATTGVTSTGQVVPLTPAPDQMMNDVAHSYYSALTSMNGGAMNGFDLIDGANINGNFLAYTQMTEAEIPNYYKYAKYYALADHMFSSIKADSFPNHLYTIAATSGGVFSIPENPKGLGFGVGWGCDDDAGTEVTMIDTEGEISCSADPMALPAPLFWCGTISAVFTITSRRPALTPTVWAPG